MEILVITLLVILCICLAFGCTLKIQITHKHEINDTSAPIPELKENEEIPVSNMDDVIKNLNEAMEVFRDEE